MKNPIPTLALGLILALCALTGAILFFSNRVTTVSNPMTTAAAPDSLVKPTSAILNSAGQTTPQSHTASAQPATQAGAFRRDALKTEPPVLMVAGAGIGQVSGKASIRVGEKVLEPQVYSGYHQRIAVAPEQEIPIALHWPAEDNQSEDVLVHAIHGGSIDRTDTVTGEDSRPLNARRFPLDRGNPKVAFTFKAGRESGHYQVLLRRGTYEEVLEFWVPTSQPEFDPPALQ